MLPKSVDKSTQQILPAKPSQALPAWMIQMREAAQKAITVEDIQAIMQNQVQRAKEGDAAAIKFVFDQVLGGKGFQGNVVQNNFYGTHPDEPVQARPGSRDKIAAMQARVAAGRPVFSKGDSDGDDDKE